MLVFFDLEKYATMLDTVPGSLGRLGFKNLVKWGIPPKLPLSNFDRSSGPCGLQGLPFWNPITSHPGFLDSQQQDYAVNWPGFPHLPWRIALSNISPVKSAPFSEALLRPAIGEPASLERLTFRGAVNKIAIG